MHVSIFWYFQKMMINVHLIQEGDYVYLSIVILRRLTSGEKKYQRSVYCKGDQRLNIHWGPWVILQHQIKHRLEYCTHFTNMRKLFEFALFIFWAKSIDHNASLYAFLILEYLYCIIKSVMITLQLLHSWLLNLAKQINQNYI